MVTKNIIQKKVDAINEAWGQSGFPSMLQFESAPRFYQFEGAEVGDTVNLSFTAHWFSFECSVSLKIMHTEGVFEDSTVEEVENFPCDIDVSAGGDCIPPSVASMCAFEVSKFVEERIGEFGLVLVSF